MIWPSNHWSSCQEFVTMIIPYLKNASMIPLNSSDLRGRTCLSYHVWRHTFLFWQFLFPQQLGDLHLQTSIHYHSCGQDKSSQEYVMQPTISSPQILPILLNCISHKESAHHLLSWHCKMLWGPSLPHLIMPQLYWTLQSISKMSHFSILKSMQVSQL